MFTIDHINELRAELAECFFSKYERRALEAELAALVSESLSGNIKPDCIAFST